MLDCISNLPKSIRVGPFDIAIEVWTPDRSAGERKWGAFSGCEQKISIDGGMGQPIKAVDTLLHEIGHAIWWAYDIQDEDKQERTVTAFATGWTQVYRDNPWLLTWIGESLGSSRALHQRSSESPS